jgi:hypothetical protein
LRAGARPARNRGATNLLAHEGHDFVRRQRSAGEKALHEKKSSVRVDREVRPKKVAEPHRALECRETSHNVLLKP